jgi:4-amino-4-deoxy-L-arabinose transferase-like glycosyltransferase
MMLKTKIRLPSAIWLIILCGAAIRMFYLNQPLLEGALTRQAHTAMIARNFYHHGFKLFYPQAEGLGNYPFYLMQEFYIIPYLAALFYWFLGGVHEWVLRLISCGFYILACLMLFRMARYYYNERAANFSALLFSLSPLSIYLGRAVHPEMAIAFLNISAVYYFSRWMDGDKAFCGLLAGLSFVLSVLLKLPDLYMLLPLLFLAYRKYGASFLGKKKLLIFLLACGTPIALFNYHQQLVRVAFPNYGMESFKFSTGLRYIGLFLANKDFYKIMFDNLATYTLTPLGFGIFLLSLFLRRQKKTETVFPAWLLAVAAFFLLAPAQSLQGYYQIHLLAPACVIMGRFVDLFSESQLYRENFIRRRIFLALLALFAGIMVLRYSYAYYRVPPNLRYVVDTGKALNRLTQPDALIITTGDRSCGLLYYCGRRGWVLDIDTSDKKNRHIIGEAKENAAKDIILRFESFKKSGAQFLACSSADEFFASEGFASYMLKNYRPLVNNGRYIIFDLRKAP